MGWLVSPRVQLPHSVVTAQKNPMRRTVYTPWESCSWLASAVCLEYRSPERWCWHHECVFSLRAHSVLTGNPRGRLARDPHPLFTHFTWGSHRQRSWLGWSKVVRQQGQIYAPNKEGALVGVGMFLNFTSRPPKPFFKEVNFINKDKWPSIALLWIGF